MNYLIAAAWALAAWVLYRLVQNWRLDRYHAPEARRLGCELPPRLQNHWPLGYDWVVKSLISDYQRRFLEYIFDRFKTVDFKTHSYHILGIHGFMTSDPKNIQALLATQFKDFGLTGFRRPLFTPLLGDGIFTSDGPAWEHSRAIMRPQFAREQISDLEIEEKHIQNMMRALPISERDGWTAEVDIQQLFFRLTLDSASDFLFGESIDTQILSLPQELGGSKDPEKHTLEGRFARAFDIAQFWLARRARFLDYYWLIDGPWFRVRLRECHRFLDHFVQRALAHGAGLSEKERAPLLEKGEGAGTDRKRYIFLEALAEHTRDPIALRSQLLNILLAGRDTTASLLGWCYWELARRPEMYTRLRQEIVHEFGTWEDPRDITFSRLKSCNAIQHLLNETLRIYPIVPVNTRRSQCATTLPRGGGPDGSKPIYIRPGQNVDYCIFLTHRDPALWGPDADEFKPERWQGRKPGWEFLPFNGGPRICLGQQFALTEASYVLVRLVQRFDRLEPRDDSELLHRLTLTDCAANGVKVRLHAAAH